MTLPLTYDECRQQVGRLVWAINQAYDAAQALPLDPGPEASLELFGNLRPRSLRTKLQEIELALHCIADAKDWAAYVCRSVTDDQQEPEDE